MQALSSSPLLSVNPQTLSELNRMSPHDWLGSIQGRRNLRGTLLAHTNVYIYELDIPRGCLCLALDRESSPSLDLFLRFNAPTSSLGEEDASASLIQAEITPRGKKIIKLDHLSAGTYSILLQRITPILQPLKYRLSLRTRSSQFSPE